MAIRNSCDQEQGSTALDIAAKVEQLVAVIAGAC
jgi:hypothetical protein